MTLETLRLFCEIVRRQSFSGGARAAGVSQSAASQAVAQLEAQTGAVLLDRTQRPFALTPQGRTYYEGLRSLLEEYDRLSAEVRSARPQVAGIIRVAAIYSIGVYAMSRHVQQFMSRYPQAKVRLEYLRPNSVVDAVLNGSAELGLLSYPAPQRSLTVLPLRSEPMICVALPTHKLARKRNLEPRDLDGENFVAFDPDLAIRKAIDRHLRTVQAHPNVVMEFDNIENIKQALLAGAGISILPEPSVQRETALGELTRLSLPLPGLARPIGIIHLRRRHLTPSVTQFIQELKTET